MSGAAPRRKRYVLCVSHTTANAFGALALAVADRMHEAVAGVAGHGASGPAALVALDGLAAGGSIDSLAGSSVSRTPGRFAWSTGWPPRGSSSAGSGPTHAPSRSISPRRGGGSRGAS